MRRHTFIPSVRALGIVAGVSVAAALLAVVLTGQPKERPFEPAPYFPGLEARLTQVARIHIQSKDQTTDIAFSPETGWTIPSKDGYRARYDEIQRLLLALSGLERFERKTKEPKWFGRLLLADPREKGEGTLVQLMDAKGAPVAELLIGVNADVGNVNDKAQIYTRVPGDNQVWLARGEGISTLSANPDEWIEKDIVDLPKEEIVRVEVKPESGPGFALVHPKADDKSFVVEGQPGLKVKRNLVDSIADGLAGLRLRDVARQDRIAFTEASPAVTLATKEGLIIRAEIAKLGEDHWMRLIATAAPNASDLGKRQAATLARRFGPWVYEIERFKGAAMTSSLASLQDAPPDQKPPAAADANPAGAAGNAVSSGKAPPRQTQQKSSKPTPNKSRKVQ